MRGHWQAKSARKGGHRNNSFRRKHTGKPRVDDEGHVRRTGLKRTESEIEKAKRQRERQGKGLEQE